jgi:hypothetical protein
MTNFMPLHTGITKYGGENIPESIQKMEVEDWANSPEGQQALLELKERGDRFSKRMEDMMKIDPKTLYRPFTI